MNRCSCLMKANVAGLYEPLLTRLYSHDRVSTASVQLKVLAWHKSIL